jgi:LysR family transcriptional activator of nhaA
MEWLNYHHLLYFWVVAREGSVTRASRELRLAKPTISNQIHQLEKVLGQQLMEKRGRNLVLTDAGRVAFDYADQIFNLGKDFMAALRGQRGSLGQKLVVGVADILPKPVVRRLLEPALRLSPAVRLICREDRRVDEFLSELALHSLDLVLSDSPANAGLGIRAFSHQLGDCGTTVFAAPRLAARLRPGFPRSLERAPCLMPGAHSLLRRGVDQWLKAEQIVPQIVAEFDDSALMNVFGQDGEGAFFGPSLIEEEVERRYRVRPVGRIPTLRQRFYAITGDRRIKHPATLAITQSARKDLFA